MYRCVAGRATAWLSGVLWIHRAVAIAIEFIERRAEHLEAGHADVAQAEFARHDLILAYSLIAEAGALTG